MTFNAHSGDGTQAASFGQVSKGHLCILRFHCCVVLDKSLSMSLKGLIHYFGNITYGYLPYSETSLAFFSPNACTFNMETNLAISATDKS